MQAAGFQLGIDFGTSHTAAVLRWPDGRAKPLLFDGSPLLPSAVYVDPSGRFMVGRDALHGARTEPGRCEPNPKRHIDDGSVLLGDREVPVVDLVSAVLGLVGREAERTAGERPTRVTLTYPAAWAAPRRRVLGAAGVLAGLGDVRMVEEPVAAATYFARVLGHRMAVGSVVVVYDFGGGTFDVSVVERMANGFRTLAVNGRDDIGGLDLDEALVRRIGEVYGQQDPAAWRRLAAPSTTQERRHRRLFRDDVRAVKERLSRYPSAELYVPEVDRDAHVTREEFEQLARPLLEQTVRLTESVVREAGVSRERIAGVFLVGGSSRIPLVGTLVHRGLQIAPTAIEQPELVVAEGSILVQGIVASARPTTVTPERPPTSGAAPAAGTTTATPTPVSGSPAGPGVSGTPASRAVSGTPAPASGTPAPASGAPAPASGTPAPASGAPAPASGAPAPVSGAPAPVSGAPAPVSGAPAGRAVSGSVVTPTPVSGAPAGPIPVSGGPATSAPASGGPGASAPASGGPGTYGAAPAVPGRPTADPRQPTASPGPARTATGRRPAPDSSGGPKRPATRRRWVMAAAFVAVLATVAVVLVLRPGRRQGDDPAAPSAVPVACSVISRDPEASRLEAGSPPTAPSLSAPENWTYHEDPTGFRLALPQEWTFVRTDDASVCFRDPHERRMLGVSQWQPTDDDILGYWRRQESRLAGTLAGYQKIRLDRKDLHDAGAEWEFTYDEGGERMHARAAALISGSRAYGISWATRESDWQNNLGDYARVIGGFRPAR